MRMRGDTPPKGPFALERLPKQPGMALVRFYERVQPVEETDPDSGRTYHGYEYDEYQLALPLTPGLLAALAANPGSYLAQAKQREAEREAMPRLRAQLAALTAEKAALARTVGALEAQLTDTQLALCEVYEQAAVACNGEV